MRAPAALLLTLLTGCTVSSSETLVLHPGDRATASALGTRPALIVRNLGPAPIRVDFTEGVEPGSADLAESEEARRLTTRGPISANITPLGRANVELEALRTDGLVVITSNTRPD